MSVSLYHYDYDALRLVMRTMRIKAKLTQTDMSKALSVGQPYISKLERGENFVDVLLYARWCEACGVKAGRALDKLLDSKLHLALS
jgi:transcriptional regulator with XRE-family HTH domain